MFTLPMTCMRCSMRKMRRSGLQPNTRTPRHAGKGLGVTVEAQVTKVREFSTSTQPLVKMAYGVCPNCGATTTRLLKTT